MTKDKIQDDPSSKELGKKRDSRAFKGIFHSRDGAKIYYESSGQGPALIFCYGLVCRREHWRYQVRHFEDRYQVITFDYRGHQGSTAPKNDRNLTLEWCATDVIDLIRHLNLSEVVCLGHSLGVPVSLLASRIEPKIKGLVLVCGPVNNPFENMFYTNRVNYLYKLSAIAYEHAPDATSLVWNLFTKTNRLSFLLTSQLGFNPETALERDILSYMEGVNQTPFGVFQGILRDYTQFDARPWLGEVQVPSLVVAGENDLVTPLHVMKEMAAALPRSEFKVVPEGSHNAHLDFPLEVNSLIEEFLIQLSYV